MMNFVLKMMRFAFKTQRDDGKRAMSGGKHVGNFYAS